MNIVHLEKSLCGVHYILEDIEISRYGNQDKFKQFF